MKLLLTTTAALVAFAFNSILCRLALGTEAIDPTSFTALRLISGAVILILISFVINRRKQYVNHSGNWVSAFFLFAYAICFSFAYVGLTTATGALILFGMVQATMVIASIIGGQRPTRLEWTGLSVALLGLVYLVFPGLQSPPLLSSLLMAGAGVAWAFYTLRGRSSENPLADTTGNFVRSVPFVVLVSLPMVPRLSVSSNGILLAVLSGTIASGVGYSIWYYALRYHSATRAAVLQLSVPLIAAAGGVLLVSESVSIRLPIAGFLILGGILLTILGKPRLMPSVKQ